jgi:hypothetical protein
VPCEKDATGWRGFFRISSSLNRPLEIGHYVS